MTQSGHQQAPEMGYFSGNRNESSTRNSALKEKGVLSGKRIERSEVGAPGEFEAMSDDELLDALHERFGDGETQH